MVHRFRNDDGPADVKVAAALEVTEDTGVHRRGLPAPQADLAGICVIRDAADMVPLLCGHYLRLGFDHLAFVDDGSSDGTSERLADLRRQCDRISVTRVESNAFRQPQLVSDAANRLIDQGYRTIVPFDADEFWNLTPGDVAELRAMALETVFYGRWANFVQDRNVTISDAASHSRARYRAPVLPDAWEAGITTFQQPFVCYAEQKIAVRTAQPIVFARGQHALTTGPTLALDREFEVFHLPLRSRRELQKRAFNYEPRRALVREGSHESWQSAFHREAVLGGRLDEVWAANSANANGCLDVFGKPLRLIPDGRLERLLDEAAAHFRATFEPGAGGARSTSPPTATVPAAAKEANHGHAPATAFAQRGFLGPLPILTRAQCELLMRHVRRGEQVPLPCWEKSRAVSDYLVYDIATQPALLGLLRPLLGEHIILWGACVQSRAPRQVHPWHTDIETSRPGMRSVSVWIGIEHTSRESSLQVISGSHRFERTIQEVVQAHGLRRGDASAQMVEAWAQEIDGAARFVKPDMTDGEAIVFDGRLWHGTDNTRWEGTRSALILQYASADEAIGVPDLSQLEWPFRYRAERPPVLLVCGDATSGHNDVVSAPALVRSAPSPHVLHAWTGPLERNRDTGWQPHFIFDGSTANLDQLTVHASVLEPGACPHPPHAHPEEEILIVLDGNAVCVMPDEASQKDPREEALAPGSFTYYPAYQFHTIRNDSDRPVTYLMMKWRGPIGFEAAQFEAQAVRPAPVTTHPGEDFAPRFLMEFPSSYLVKLHAHQTTLSPGAGYEPHADEHDVAIVVLEGEVETQDRRFGPNAFILHSAGERHGIRNVGTGLARYLVFEFHAPSPARDDGAAAGRLMKQMKAAQGREAALAAALASTARELETTKVTLDNVFRSLSWQVTGPLRTIAGTLLRLRR